MSWQRVRSTFEVLVMLPEQEREARLHALETTDRWLAGQVRSLLKHDAEASRFLERQSPGLAPSPVPPAVAAGLRLGRFELQKPLGSGGMGAVWQARQQDPDRQVAIKLVARGASSGASSDAERWRFEHEVQLLASLNHPSIATFFEAGTDLLDGTEVAWFGMELVVGAVDVLTWARDQALSRDARLELFRQLCEAVDYGHRRGVLHRDLKAGNVLVDHDGHLKLIDFGIARAMASDDRAESARTQTGQVVGTIQYMAPEQLRGEGDAIGTQSDVYALGALLYQLLCSRAPFDFDGLSMAQIVTQVLEQEPFPPRQADPTLPAELGWILLRALEKDASRRYPTVAGLVDDLRRFGAHLPVHAGPPSVGYRVRKFVRRHRVALGVAAVLSIGFGVGVFGLWQGMQEARAGERAAVRGFEMSREVTSTMVRLFDGIKDTAQSRDMKVHELLDRTPFAAGEQVDPLVESTVRAIRGEIYSRLHQFDAATREFERAVELLQDPAIPADEESAAHAIRLDSGLGRALAGTGKFERGERLLRTALARAEAAALPRQRLRVLLDLCSVLCDRNSLAELEQRATTAVALARELADPAAECNAESYLVDAATMLEHHEAALESGEGAWRRAVAAWGEHSVQAVQMLERYVLVLQQGGQPDDAERLYPQLIAGSQAAFGPDHVNVLTVLSNQCELFYRRGQLDDAITTMQDVVARYERGPGKGSLNHLIAVNNLGQSLNQRGRFAEAEPYLARASALTHVVLDAKDPDGSGMRFNHGACLAWQKRWAEAEPILLAEYELSRQLLPVGHSRLGKLRRTIAAAYEQNGHPEQAAQWRKP